MLVQDLKSPFQNRIKEKNRKDCGLSWQQGQKKRLDFILVFGQCPTGLLRPRLSHWVRPSPAARRPLPATQTVRENMTSSLYHPLDTLKARSSAGSNARCRWRLLFTCRSVFEQHTEPQVAPDGQVSLSVREANKCLCLMVKSAL